MKVNTNIKNCKVNVLLNGEWTEKTGAELFDNKTVVLFAVPGAFTPDCSEKHLPGFVSKYGELKDRGIDEVYCLAVNDNFVLSAWAKDQKLQDGVKLIGDGLAEFTKKFDLTLDLSHLGVGIGARSKRYAMIVTNGTVTHIDFDDDSFAEKVLEKV